MLTGFYGLLMLGDHQAKKGDIILAGVMTDYHEEIGLLLYNRKREKYAMEHRRVHCATFGAPTTSTHLHSHGLTGPW